MPVFKVGGGSAQRLPLKRDGFGNEFALRDFFADNLEEILGVRFLAKEYQTPDGRIDTLGLDENGSPVIIEYKWRENEEVLSQGLFYRHWLLRNKAHFELLAKDKLGGSVEVSWERPRVILVAQGFSRYVQAAAREVDGVELKSYALYEDGVLHVENEYSPTSERQRRREEPRPERSEAGEEPTYGLDYHLGVTSPEMREFAQALRDRILALPSVEERAGQKTGITYATTKSFARLEFRPTWIQLLLRDASYPEDAARAVQDITANEWGYKGKVRLDPKSDPDGTFALIEASYRSTL